MSQLDFGVCLVGLEMNCKLETVDGKFKAISDQVDLISADKDIKSTPKALAADSNKVLALEKVGELSLPSNGSWSLFWTLMRLLAAAREATDEESKRLAFIFGGAMGGDGYE